MKGRGELHERLGRALRDPMELTSLTGGAGPLDPRLLEHRSDASFWKTLRSLKVRLLVSREYEHLAVSLAAPTGRPEITTFPLPHPSGIAVDGRTGGFHVACTRNPNILIEFRPAASGVLVPIRSRVLPGRLYLHDLAWIGGRLHGNAVGENALVRLSYDEEPKRVWWPRSIERNGTPDFSRNLLQLNSTAAGLTVGGSFYSASCERAGSEQPGDPAFKVDGRGVIFSGRTRLPVVEGLTRPHSVRFHRGRLWVDNSGYGEVGFIEKGGFVRHARLPGWTRGLSIVGNVLFVATSAVLRRFRSYAPGLDPDRCVCGVHAIDLVTGRVLGSVEWPWGNQVFAVEAMPQHCSAGFPAQRDKEAVRDLFYSLAMK
jgi:uncharacterized protein (TIGR03032 family)